MHLNGAKRNSPQPKAANSYGGGREVQFKFYSAGRSNRPSDPDFRRAHPGSTFCLDAASIVNQNSDKEHVIRDW